MAFVVQDGTAEISNMTNFCPSSDRLFYNIWEWNEKSIMKYSQEKRNVDVNSLNEMTEKLGSAIRVTLEWLEDIHDPADLIIELYALQQ